VSKPIKHSFVCSCGHSFEAAIFKSANVTLQPDLKAQIFSGQFNWVRCSACQKEIDAGVPFLYHDMDVGLMVWVYPPMMASQAAVIRDKVRRSHVIVGSVLPVPGVPAGCEVVFGVEALRDLIRDMTNP
jgi:hypothetical protein